MNSLGAPLWWIVGLLALIYFHMDDNKLLDTATIYPVECKLEGAEGHRHCKYYSSPFSIVIRANLASNEVVVFVPEDTSRAGSDLLTGCTIANARNFDCRWAQWPGQDRFESYHIVRDGKFFESNANDSLAKCYPNQLVRWAISLGVFPTDYDESEMVRDWLNCAKWFKF